MVLFKFLNFFAIFLEFFIMRQVGTERNDNFFFSSFLILLQPWVGLNGAIIVFFNFFELFSIFLEFSITRWVGMKRNDNIYFLSLLAFSNLF